MEARSSAGHTVTGPDEHALAVARYQGRRLARYAGVIGAARREGLFAVRRPSTQSFAGASNREPGTPQVTLERSSATTTLP